MSDEGFFDPVLRMLRLVHARDAVEYCLGWRPLPEARRNRSICRKFVSPGSGREQHWHGRMMVENKIGKSPSEKGLSGVRREDWNTLTRCMNNNATL